MNEKYIRQIGEKQLGGIPLEINRKVVRLSYFEK